MKDRFFEKNEIQWLSFQLSGQKIGSILRSLDSGYMSDFVSLVKELIIKIPAIRGLISARLALSQPFEISCDTGDSLLDYELMSLIESIGLKSGKSESTSDHLFKTIISNCLMYGFFSGWVNYNGTKPVSISEIDPFFVSIDTSRNSSMVDGVEISSIGPNQYVECTNKSLFTSKTEASLGRTIIYSSAILWNQYARDLNIIEEHSFPVPIVYKSDESKQYTKADNNAILEWQKSRRSGTHAVLPNGFKSGYDIPELNKIMPFFEHVCDNSKEDLRLLIMGQESTTSSGNIANEKNSSQIANSIALNDISLVCDLLHQVLSRYLRLSKIRHKRLLVWPIRREKGLTVDSRQA